LGNKKQASEGLALLACLDFSPGYLFVMKNTDNTETFWDYLAGVWFCNQFVRSLRSKVDGGWVQALRLEVDREQWTVLFSVAVPREGGSHPIGLGWLGEGLGE
jgi:phosphatidylglycerophosphatase A